MQRGEEAKVKEASRINIVQNKRVMRGRKTLKQLCAQIDEDELKRLNGSMIFLINLHSIGNEIT